jgi:hypothetical protein
VRRRRSQAYGHVRVRKVFEIGFGRALSVFLDCLEQSRRNIQLEVFEFLVSHAYTLDGVRYLYGCAIVIAFQTRPVRPRCWRRQRGSHSGGWEAATRHETTWT